MTIAGTGASVFTLLLVCGVFFVAFLLYCFLALVGRRPRSVEMQARGETVFLPLFVREYWDWVISPVTTLLIRMRVNPNGITFFSCLVSLAAGVAFARGMFGLGGWLYILGGTCDMFDGKVARATGQESKAGAFIDSVLDRYTEVFVLGGLAFYFRHSWVLWVIGAALAGSLMVSYTRARGEGLGYSCREGGMQRAERIVYIGLAGVLGDCAMAVWPVRNWATLFLTGSIVLLAISTNVTAFQRFLTIVRVLRSADGAAERGGVIIKAPFWRKVQP